MCKTIALIFFWQLWGLGVGAAIGQPAPFQPPASDPTQVLLVFKVSDFMPRISSLQEFIDLPVVFDQALAQGQHVVSERRTKAVFERILPIQAANAEGSSRSQQSRQRRNDWRQVLIEIIQILFPIAVFIPAFRAALDSGKKV